MKTQTISFLIFCLVLLSKAFCQEPITEQFSWEYDLPDTKETQLKRVYITLKYELFTEKIYGEKYKVWAKYTCTKATVWPERGGIYYYKRQGKWYNSHEMWNVDPRTLDGWSNTYGFIPDIEITSIVMYAKMPGGKEVLISPMVSDSWHYASAILGEITDLNELKNFSITPNNTRMENVSFIGSQRLHERIKSYENKLSNIKQYEDLIKAGDAYFNSGKYTDAKTAYENALKLNDSNTAKQKLQETVKRIENQETEEKVRQQNANPSSTSNNTPAPTKSAEQIAEEKKQAEVERIREQYRQEEIRRQEENRQLEQTLNNAANTAMGIYEGAQRMREENEAKRHAMEQKREMEQKINFAEGKALLDVYLPLSKQGNETAVKNVDKAYSLMQKEEERISFLKNQHNNNKSAYSRNALLAHYNNELWKSDREIKTLRKSGIGKLIGGAFLFGGGYTLFHLTNNNVIFEGLPAFGYIFSVPMMVTGVVLPLFSIPNFVHARWEKNSQERRQILHNIDRLNSGGKLAFGISPSINYLNFNHSGVSLTLTLDL